MCSTQQTFWASEQESDDCDPTALRFVVEDEQISCRSVCYETAGSVTKETTYYYRSVCYRNVDILTNENTLMYVDKLLVSATNENTAI